MSERGRRYRARLAGALAGGVVAAAALAIAARPVGAVEAVVAPSAPIPAAAAVRWDAGRQALVVPFTGEVPRFELKAIAAPPMAFLTLGPGHGVAGELAGIPPGTAWLLGWHATRHADGRLQLAMALRQPARLAVLADRAQGVLVVRLAPASPPPVRGGGGREAGGGESHPVSRGGSPHPTLPGAPPLTGGAEATPAPTPTPAPATPTPPTGPAMADQVAFGAAVGGVAAGGVIAPLMALSVDARPRLAPGWRTGLDAALVAAEPGGAIHPSWLFDVGLRREWDLGWLALGVGPGAFVQAPVGGPNTGPTTAGEPLRLGPAATAALRLAVPAPGVEGSRLGLDAAFAYAPWAFPAGGDRRRADLALTLDVAGARAHLGWRAWTAAGASAAWVGGPYLGLTFTDRPPESQP